MRKPKFLSYSAQSCFFADRDEYCLRYLVDTKIPRAPQTYPLAIGSAFDAKIKSELYAQLYGNSGDGYSFEELFEAQVEPHNRDWALQNIVHICKCYVDSGLYAELLDLLRKSTIDPRFEFTVEANINDVPILGKPDCYFEIDDLKFILDWKVNGYLSTRGLSPAKGFRLCRDGWIEGRHTKTHDTSHAMYKATNSLGVSEHYLEDSNPQWAEQLSIYGWALGLDIGDEDVVFMIDQLVCKPLPDTFPAIRVANYRSRVRDCFQEYFANKLRDCWQAINSPATLFLDQGLTETESTERFNTLNMTAESMLFDNPHNSFNVLTR